MRSFIPILLGLFLAAPPKALASVSVNVNGSSYQIPQNNEKGWGTNVTTWIQAISANTLQPVGGTFTLTGDANLGTSFGLIGIYKSTSSNIAGTGTVRLNNNSDSISWRNAANNADLPLIVNGSNQLQFNGVAIGTASSASFSDAGFSIYNSSDNTKKIAFSAAGITTGNTRTYTMPDVTSNIIGTTGTFVNHGVMLGSTFQYQLGSGTSAGSAGQILASGGGSADPNWTTPTYPIASGSVGQILRADGTNNVYSTNTFPNTAAAGTILNASSANAFSATATPTLGVAATTAGTLTLANATGAGNVSIATASAASSWTLTLPTGHGGSGQVLQTDGSGNTSWTGVANNPATAAYDTLYQNAGNTALTNLANGTTGQYLKATSSGAPSWTSFTRQTVTTETSTGSQTGTVFVVSGVTTSPTNGATYANNGHTFTVIQTSSDKTQVFTVGIGSTTGSTIGKTGGTGDSSLTFSATRNLASYTPPATAKALWVRTVGGGGGGGGTASATSASGAAGGGGGGGYSEKLISSFDSTIYYEIGSGGSGGVAGDNNGTGGGQTSLVDSQNILITGGGAGGSGSATVTVASLTGTGGNGGTSSGGDLNIPGSPGGCGQVFGTSGTGNCMSGYGGSTPLGGGANSQFPSANGINGGVYGGGGSGGTEINNAGTKAGGNGSAGVVIVHEIYNGN